MGASESAHRVVDAVRDGLNAFHHQGRTEGPQWDSLFAVLNDPHGPTPQYIEQNKHQLVLQMRVLCQTLSVPTPMLRVAAIRNSFDTATFAVGQLVALEPVAASNLTCAEDMIRGLGSALRVGWGVHHGVGKFAANSLTVLATADGVRDEIQVVAINTVLRGLSRWLHDSEIKVTDRDSESPGGLEVCGCSCRSPSTAATCFLERLLSQPNDVVDTMTVAFPDLLDTIRQLLVVVREEQGNAFSLSHLLLVPGVWRRILRHDATGNLAFISGDPMNVSQAIKTRMKGRVKSTSGGCNHQQHHGGSHPPVDRTNRGRHQSDTPRRRISRSKFERDDIVTLTPSSSPTATSFIEASEVAATTVNAEGAPGDPGTGESASTNDIGAVTGADERGTSLVRFSSQPRRSFLSSLGRASGQNRSPSRGDAPVRGTTRRGRKKYRIRKYAFESMVEDVLACLTFALLHIDSEVFVGEAVRCLLEFCRIDCPTPPRQGVTLRADVNLQPRDLRFVDTIRVRAYVRSDRALREPLPTGVEDTECAVRGTSHSALAAPAPSSSLSSSSSSVKRFSPMFGLTGLRAFNRPGGGGGNRRNVTSADSIHSGGDDKRCGTSGWSDSFRTGGREMASTLALRSFTAVGMYIAKHPVSLEPCLFVRASASSSSLPSTCSAVSQDVAAGGEVMDAPDVSAKIQKKAVGDNAESGFKKGVQIRDFYVELACVRADSLQYGGSSACGMVIEWDVTDRALLFQKNASSDDGHVDVEPSPAPLTMGRRAVGRTEFQKSGKRFGNAPRHCPVREGVRSKTDALESPPAAMRLERGRLVLRLPVDKSGDIGPRDGYRVLGLRSQRSSKSGSEASGSPKSSAGRSMASNSVLAEDGSGGAVLVGPPSPLNLRHEERRGSEPSDNNTAASVAESEVEAGLRKLGNGKSAARAGGDMASKRQQHDGEKQVQARLSEAGVYRFWQRVIQARDGRITVPLLCDVQDINFMDLARDGAGPTGMIWHPRRRVWASAQGTDKKSPTEQPLRGVGKEEVMAVETKEEMEAPKATVTVQTPSQEDEIVTERTNIKKGNAVWDMGAEKSIGDVDSGIRKLLAQKAAIPMLEGLAVAAVQLPVAVRLLDRCARDPAGRLALLSLAAALVAQCSRDGLSPAVGTRPPAAASVTATIRSSAAGDLRGDKEQRPGVDADVPTRPAGTRAGPSILVPVRGHRLAHPGARDHQMPEVRGAVLAMDEFLLRLLERHDEATSKMGAETTCGRSSNELSCMLELTTTINRIRLEMTDVADRVSRWVAGQHTRVSLSAVNGDGQNDTEEDETDEDGCFISGKKKASDAPAGSPSWPRFCRQIEEDLRGATASSLVAERISEWAQPGECFAGRHATLDSESKNGTVHRVGEVDYKHKFDRATARQREERRRARLTQRAPFQKADIFDPRLPSWPIGSHVSAPLPPSARRELQSHVMARTHLPMASNSAKTPAAAALKLSAAHAKTALQDATSAMKTMCVESPSYSNGSPSWVEAAEAAVLAATNMLTSMSSFSVAEGRAVRSGAKSTGTAQQQNVVTRGLEHCDKDDEINQGASATAEEGKSAIRGQGADSVKASSSKGARLPTLEVSEVSGEHERGHGHGRNDVVAGHARVATDLSTSIVMLEIVGAEHQNKARVVAVMTTREKRIWLNHRLYRINMDSAERIASATGGANKVAGGNDDVADHKGVRRIYKPRGEEEDVTVQSGENNASTVAANTKYTPGASMDLRWLLREEMSAGLVSDSTKLGVDLPVQPQLGSDEPLAFIECDRNESILKELHRMHSSSVGVWDNISGQVEVRFKDEVGSGSAVLREWLAHATKALLDPALDVMCSRDGRRSFWPSPTSGRSDPRGHLMTYQSIGRIVGVALLHRMCLPLRFEPTFSKLLLNGGQLWEWTLEDVKAADPNLYKHKIRYVNEHDISDLDIDFSVALADGVEVPLKPGGLDLDVTEENKSEYIRLLCEWRLCWSVRHQVRALLQGLHSIVPRATMSDLSAMVSPLEFTEMVAGLPTIDIEDWRRNTRYIGFNESMPLVEWFWNVIRRFEPKDREALLQFVTGSTHPPVGGFAHLEGFNGGEHRFTIAKAIGRTVEALPTSHACICTMDIPEYVTEAQLEQRLRAVTTHGSLGFSEG